jgi:tetratricopeptide (TPR) repeat protein
MTTETSPAAALLDQARQLPHSIAQRDLLDQALGLLVDGGNEELEYQVRELLMNCAERTGDTAAVLANFSWCLARYDANAPYLTDRQRHTVLWIFKWVGNNLAESPLFSLDQISSVLDDMESHYRRAGLGMNAVWWTRFGCARQTGDYDAAARCYAEYLATPRDDYSDCEACTLSSMADYQRDLGKPDEALKLVDQIIERNLQCSCQPESAMGGAMIDMLQAGRLDEAKSAQGFCYRAARNRLDEPVVIGDCLEFCAVTGNEARGLAMVERHLNLLGVDALADSARFHYLAQIAGSLDAVVSCGHGDQLVRGTDDPQLASILGIEPAVLSADQLAPVMWQAAGRLADSFNARNGNDDFSRQLARSRERFGQHFDVPINSEVFLEVPALIERTPQGFDGWLAYARASQVSHTQALEALGKALDLAETSEQQFAAQRSLLSRQCSMGDVQSVTQELPKLVQSARLAGQEGYAKQLEDLGVVMFSEFDSDSVQRVRSELSFEWEPEDRARLLDTLFYALAEEKDDSDPDALTEMAGFLDQVADTSTDPRTVFFALLNASMIPGTELTRCIELVDRALKVDMPDFDRALALRQRAACCGMMNKPLDGVADADEATRLNVEWGFRVAAASAANLAGQLLISANKYQDALSRLRYGLHLIDGVEDPGNLESLLKYHIGRALCLNGDAMEASEIFAEVADLEEKAEVSPGDRADTFSWLGTAFRDDRYYGNAALAFRKAADLFEAAEDPLNAANQLRRSGMLWRELNLLDESLTDIDRALKLADGHDEDQPGFLAAVWESRCFTDVQLRDEQQAMADIDHAIRFAAAAGDARMAAGLGCTRAQTLAAFDHGTESVAGYLESADAFEKLDILTESVRAEFFAGQVSEDKNPDLSAVVVLYSNAFTRSADVSEAEPELVRLHQLIGYRLAAALESLSRNDEAAAIRATLIQTEPSDQ